MPTGMDDPPITSQAVISPSPIHSSLSALLNPANIPSSSTSRITPEITNDIHQKLNIDTSDDTSDDDYSSDETSLEEDEESKKICRGLPVASLPTGLCYDERMRFHAEVQAAIGDNIHPEDPRRIYMIYKYLCEAGLVAEDHSKAFKTLANPPLLRIDAREATREECCLVHKQEHYDFVKSTQELSDEALIDLSDENRMDSIYFNNLTFFASKLSAGGAIDTCRAVMQNKVKNAIAVIRPPGHHAEINKTMGFCLFNNILILDWDVHHGNGCQEAFYQDPNILYISIHVHMDGKFYPAGDYGDMFHCGEGPGVGKNVNIPWPYKGMGDGDYIYAFQQIVMPIAFEFDPDFVIVAAGFDAAAGDELGGCFVSPACYAHMTHMLLSLAQGKVAVCLEGGYNFHSIARSALAVTKTLMGEPPDRLAATTPTESGMNTVKAVKKVQAQYWRSLHPKDPSTGIYKGERLHDIIRQWQAMHLYDGYRFTQLHIFRDQLSPSFNQQVLATPGWDEKKKLLVIFHDEPDLLGDSKSTVGEHEQHDLHNTWLVDGCKSYIQRAIDANFGVIDVNIPAHITDPNPGATYQVPVDVQKKQSEDLATYLWDNYISTSAAYDTDQIFFMGVGSAFHGIARLLSEKAEVHEAVAGVLVFIAKNPVRPVTNGVVGNLGEWYRKNSLVWVSATHNYWTDMPAGKTSRGKKFGRVVKSEETMLNTMLMENEAVAWKWIIQRAANGDGSDESEEGERKGRTSTIMSMGGGQGQGQFGGLMRREEAVDVPMRMDG